MVWLWLIVGGSLAVVLATMFVRVLLRRASRRNVRHESQSCVFEHCGSRDPASASPELEAVLERKASPAGRDCHETRSLKGVQETIVPPSVLDANVQFTVYKPRTVRPEVWTPMLVFTHVSERPPNADPSNLDPLQEVEAQAKAVLAKNLENYGSLRQDSSAAIPRSGEITLVPVVGNVEFNPTARSFFWQGEVQREEFKLRAPVNLDGQSIGGSLFIYYGAVVLAEVRINLQISSKQTLPQGDEGFERERARRFRKIFASYSHKDQQIVTQFEGFAKAIGDEFLRDVTYLQVGEIWTERLETMIRESDVFQLFWSWNSIQSSFVEREWRYALGLNRARFVCPVYWEDPLPEFPERKLPPEELRRLQFRKLYFETTNQVAPSVPLPSEGGSLGLQLGWNARRKLGKLVLEVQTDVVRIKGNAFKKVAELTADGFVKAEKAKLNDFVRDVRQAYESIAVTTTAATYIRTVDTLLSQITDCWGKLRELECTPNDDLSAEIRVKQQAEILNDAIEDLSANLKTFREIWHKEYSPGNLRSELRTEADLTVDLKKPISTPHRPPLELGQGPPPEPSMESDEELAPTRWTTINSASEDRTFMQTHPPYVSVRPLIPNYEFLADLGHGSFGRVWLVRDAAGSLAAAKVIHDVPYRSHDTYEKLLESNKRYLREISGQNAHLIRVRELHVDNKAGCFSCIMDAADDQTSGSQIDPHSYVPRTLNSEIKRQGRLPTKQCIDLGISLGEGLEFLHRKGLLHRDVKPQNVLFIKGRPVLADIDFIEHPRPQAYVDVGTVGYMPAEASSETSAADLFALGKLLYVAMTGLSASKFPELPEEVVGFAGVTLGLHKIIAKACSPDFREHYTDAVQLLGDLRNLESEV